MALKANLVLEAQTQTITRLGTLDSNATPVTLSDCYVKVETVEASKTMASAVVSIKSDKGTLTNRYHFTPDLDGDNFIAQSYVHLKTLPEFADAVDC